jgi:glucan 1,4-alpha-glucosidase
MGRDFTLSLDFLETGKTYEALLYQDGAGADWASNPESYRIEKKMVTAQTKLPLKLAKGGGCAIQLIQR